MLADERLKPVLVALASQPNLFPTKSKSLDKALVDAVAVQLKSKACTLEEMRAIAGAIGRDALEAVVGRQLPSAVGSLVKQYDKTNAQRAKEDFIWGCNHLVALAMRAKDPEPPPAKAKTTAGKKRASPRAKNPKTDNRQSAFQSKAFGRRE